MRPALARDEIGQGQVLLLERRQWHRSAGSPPRRTWPRARPSAPASFSSLSSTLGAAAQARRCRTSSTARPRQTRSTLIASRVSPASGPTSRRSSPRMRLSSVDLPALGRPIDGDLQRPGEASNSLPSSSSSKVLAASVDGSGLDLGGLLRQRLEQRGIELGKAIAVLGGKRDGVAEAEFVGLDGAGAAGAALGLVGDQDQRLAGAAHQRGEGAVAPASGRRGRRR